MLILILDFSDPLLNKCTQLEPEGDFPDIRETLDHFKVSLKIEIYNFEPGTRVIVFFSPNFQKAFDHEAAKKEGFIVPKHGVDREYDAVLLELADVKKDLDAYLEKQRRHFGVQIKFCGNDRKRFQIEVPDSQEKKVGSGYELQGSRKGFKRYYTSESKVCILIFYLKVKERNRGLHKVLFQIILSIDINGPSSSRDVTFSYRGLFIYSN